VFCKKMNWPYRRGYFAQSRRPGDCVHEPRSGQRLRQWPLPSGPVLPAERVPLTVPPLRDRMEDIAGSPRILCGCCRCACTYRRQLSLRTLSVRCSNTTGRGNVRELQNVRERAMILSRGGPLQVDLPIRSVHRAARARTVRACSGATKTQTARTRGHRECASCK
jgi:transcriptional regulator with GAF, ATPase, and Fis domain